MKTVKKIELLSPAKNLEIGIAAIDHGADAVYIGAPKFSARAAAGNSLDDIRQLAEYAHLFHAKVYVALNTILYDDELPETEQLIWDLYSAGADALIIQDMGILQLNLPPIALHASTQTDNRTIEKVQFLEQTGFSQVVLARELSLNEIRDIADNTQVPLEVFVHGALCTSYSGQCYISQALSGRSSNRGECAQYCRLPYTLQDATGKTLVANKHLLSLKDLNRSEHLEELLDAGVTSLKIEGRLKDMAYVKNVTAYYRRKLDTIFEKRPEYRAASSGESVAFFVPNPQKSFNRGFTDYLLHGRKSDIASPDTPKSIGEPVGTVKEIQRLYFTIQGHKPLHNGDGLCFFNRHCEGKAQSNPEQETAGLLHSVRNDVAENLTGFRVNNVDGHKIFPLTMPRLAIGMTLYRNYDHAFETQLAKKSAERKIKIDWLLEPNDSGFSLTATDEDIYSATTIIAFPQETAKKELSGIISEQLSKLGNTIFQAEKVENKIGDRFISLSALSELKRNTIEELLRVRKLALQNSGTTVGATLAVARSEAIARGATTRVAPTTEYPTNELTYLGNVSNEKAREFYRQHGVEDIAPAFELATAQNVPLMFTKLCLKYQLGYCAKQGKSDTLDTLNEPLTLSAGANRLQLRFDCGKCEMQINNYR